MDESHIEEKLKNLTERQQLDFIINCTAQYIATWTQQEFSRIANDRTIPLIWPLSNGGYVIGHQRIISAQGLWKVYNQHGELKYTFSVKQSAIFYSLCEQVKQYNIANEILLSDHAVAHYKNDIMHYEHSLKSAKKQQDSFKISILDARLHDIRLRLTQAQERLQKSIKSAKYLKVWKK